MKRSTMVRIDRLFYPIFYLFKTLKCFVPKKEQPDNHFLIIKFFGLGSLARIVHIIEQHPSLREKVTILTLKKNASLIQELNLNAVFVDSQTVFSLIGNLIRQTFAIWRRGSTTILDMERSSNLAGLFGMTAAIGKPYRAFNFKSDKNIAGQKWISLTERTALEGIAEMLSVPLKTSASTIPENKKVIRRIGININAGDYLPERKFPINQWVMLCDKLASLYPNAQFFLTGLAHEKKYVEQFEKTWSSKNNTIKMVNLAGTQNLTEFLDFLSSLDVFITNDSGPLHLAQLQNVKTVTIWGPTSAGQVGYPEGPKMLNLASTEPCSPCFIHPKSHVAKACQGKLTCFHEMDPFEMAERIRTFIE